MDTCLFVFASFVAYGVVLVGGRLPLLCGCMQFSVLFNISVAAPVAPLSPEIAGGLPGSTATESRIPKHVDGLSPTILEPTHRIRDAPAKNLQPSPSIFEAREMLGLSPSWVVHGLWILACIDSG